MQPVPRIQSGTQITQELLDSIVRAIHELQGHAITGVNYPLTRAGGMLSAMDNVNQALVAVQNDTGGDLELGAVVGLDGPIEDDPTGNLLAFQNAELTFSGIAPSETYGHAGKFAVLVDPIPSGDIGRACIQGVVRVQVQIDDVNVADWADIDDGETGNLLAVPGGSARILWREGGAAPVTEWCIVLLIGQSDEKIRVSSDDAGPDFLRLTDAESADPPEGRQHKIVGDDEEQIDETPADEGWIACKILGAAEANQQLVIQHKHAGETLDTKAYLTGCFVNNLRLDAGHIIAIELTTSGGQGWYDAFTGEVIS